jgi:hypothetical protein
MLICTATLSTCCTLLINDANSNTYAYNYSICVIMLNEPTQTVCNTRKKYITNCRLITNCFCCIWICLFINHNNKWVIQKSYYRHANCFFLLILQTDGIHKYRIYISTGDSNTKTIYDHQFISIFENMLEKLFLPLLRIFNGSSLLLT